MWRRYRAMSGASSLSGLSRDTELFVHFIWKKKKKSLKPTDPARGADGKFPPSPAAPGFGSALAGGFEDAETQQSGIRHRSAATQALTWDRSAEGSRR